MKRFLAASALVACAAISCSDGASSSSGASGGCPNDKPNECPSTPPSFRSEVFPIIERRCTTCHAAGGRASTKDLTTYPNIYARRGSVLTRVYQCVMPPSDATQPTAEERAALLTWLVCGAPDN